MRVVSGDREHISSELYAGVATYRHKVFVEHLGWRLQVRDGQELDQFDRVDTVYIAAQDDEGRIFGCARLLPTTRPYLLGEVFPELLNGLPPPCSPDIWELSRFSAVDFGSGATTATGHFSSQVGVRLLRESLSCAAARGARRVVTVSPLGVERLLRAAGFLSHRAGPPLMIDGHAIFACWIEI